MSGHSKWNTIKRKKAKEDAKKGSLFTKIIKEMTVSARLGGGDLDSNPRLKTSVAAAKAANMPQDNIMRAIKKGTGQLPGVVYESHSYEGYGPDGVAIILEVLTDNKNRTVADIRHLFTKYNGNLGESGCVSWMFQRKGLIVVDKNEIGEDKLMEIALEAGAEDMSVESDSYEIVSSPGEFEDVKDALGKNNLKITSSEITMVSQTTLKLDEKQAEQVLKLVEKLEEHDDVQNVYANFDIPDEIMEALSNKED
ncbi:MAG: YebC/PmpR family DNA-binding transcriptional regulator [bacterium]